MKLFYYTYHKEGIASSLNKQKVSFYEVTIVLDGVLKYVVDGEQIEARSRDVLFIKKDSVRTREQADNANYFSYNFLEEDFENLPLLMRGAYNHTLSSIIHAFDETKKTTNDFSDVRLKLLFSAIVAELRFQTEQKKETDVVRRIKKYVQENITKKMTLSDVSQAVFFSVPYIEKMFKAGTGFSITHYIIKERLSMAKNLLLGNTMSLKTVALKCGFPDYNFFSRTFSKHVGCTPTAYRKRYGATIKE